MILVNFARKFRANVPRFESIGRPIERRLVVLDSTWFEPLRFACEVQSVIAMRLLRLAQGGPQAAAEASLMITEKIGAFADAEAALANALCAGEGLIAAAERAYAPVRRCVDANCIRLTCAVA